MRVSREVLFAIAGLIWLAAGLNIVSIGFGAYGSVLGSTVGNIPPIALALGSLGIFAAFGAMFARIVRKHTVRIVAYGDERQPFWRFFDRGSYLVMAFMMTLGIALRASGIAPDWFVAFFYVGLGLALALAGVGFFCSLLRMRGVCDRAA